MIYAISDIHGEYSRYLQLLNLIGFSAKDTLYVLGDMVDRGEDSIAVLRDIMSRKNIHALLGNHDRLWLDAARGIRHDDDDGPLREFLELPEEGRTEIAGFLSSLPTCLDIRVGFRRFHLVHAWPGETEEERLWTRPALDSRNPLRGRCLIVGHTPVFVLSQKNLIHIVSGEGHFKIERAKGFIDIDCGCGYPFPQRRLACLRLNDMAEFYA